MPILNEWLSGFPERLIIVCHPGNSVFLGLRHNDGGKTRTNITLKFYQKSIL
jgi:hypothetical protein